VTLFNAFKNFQKTLTFWWGPKSPKKGPFWGGGSKWGPKIKVQKIARFVSGPKIAARAKIIKNLKKFFRGVKK
jgi:hypothetical protein